MQTRPRRSWRRCSGRRRATHWVAADDAPLTREQICTVARLVSPFDARPMPAFEGGEAARGGAGTGKVIDCSYTREAVGWAPRYRTFADFIERLTP